MLWEALGLSEVVKLPTRSLVPPAKPGDRVAASRGDLGASGRLLLPETRWLTWVTPLSQSQSMEQGGFICMPGESPARGAGGCCSSSVLCRGSSLSSAQLGLAQLSPNHSQGQGNAFLRLSRLPRVINPSLGQEEKGRCYCLMSPASIWEGGGLGSSLSSDGALPYFYATWNSLSSRL